ncbi:MAG: phytoene/squalene synthase family protein [Bryobacterales bacterium]
MPTVEESFAYCRTTARSRARNFYYSFLLLPREERDAMCAVYAFMRHADDIADDITGEASLRNGAGPKAASADRAARLATWKAAFQTALEGRYGDDRILPAFHHTVRKYSIPPEYCFELIEGVGRDLSPRRYHTFDELYRYCYQVASVVGLTTIHIFGYESEAALPLAEKCGIAFQLTNILRDIPEDADLGRLYLPEEDLARFGLKPEDLLQARPGAGFREFMEFEWERANSYYEEAAPLLGMIRPACRPAFWAMVAIYKGILHRIQRMGYDVFAARPRLTAAEKTWIVLRAARSRWTGGALPFPA